MATLFAPSLQGDGIRFEFFHHLWSKNRGENTENGKGAKVKGGHSRNSSVQVRLPDTVVFRLGQPLQWYFTSERGARSSILKKRKQNVNVEKIEEVFLRKVRSTNGGELDSKNDVVAYFIASGECSSRNRQLSFVNRKDHGDSDCEVSLGDQIHDNPCDIEYFNEEGLRKFLYIDRKNQTGLLQRFIDPAGGGTHNSQIRAICAPKMCVLERRRTKQDLRDPRFGLYERAVTFEGPEVHSTSLPIRGAALPGRLREICSKVLNDISEAAMNSAKTSDPKEDKRMVLNLKVDSKERIWVLYSSSIRSIPGSSEYMPDVPSHYVPSRRTSEPLNIENVIKLSPHIKLTQKANHDPTLVISNNKKFETCPSCANVDVRENFHPVPYKTIISHFEQVMATTKKECSWPPSKDIIKSAGGVGFGTVQMVDGKDIADEDKTIPPVIRHLHNRLKIDGYRRYRSDPLFLHRKCEVCESCFLAYAKLVSNSFQIARPIKLDTELKRLGFDSIEGSRKNRGSISKSSTDCHWKRKKDEREKVSSSFRTLFLQCPSLPPAIVDPPPIQLESDKKKFMPIPYNVIESHHQPLLHLIQTHQKLASSKNTSRNKRVKKATNPYAISMKIVDPPNPSKTRKKGKSNSNRKQSLDKSLKEMTAGNNVLDDPNLSRSARFGGQIDSFGMELLSRAASKLRANG